MVRVLRDPGPEELASINYRRNIVLFTPGSNQAVETADGTVFLCQKTDLRILDLKKTNHFFLAVFKPSLMVFMPGDLNLVPTRPMGLKALSDHLHQWRTVRAVDADYCCLLEPVFHLFFDLERLRATESSPASIVIRAGEPLLELRFYQGPFVTPTDGILLVIGDDAYTLSMPKEL